MYREKESNLRMSPYQSDALTAWLSRYSTQSRIRTHAFSVCNTEALTRLSYSGKDRWVVERGKLPPIDPVGDAGFEPADVLGPKPSGLTATLISDGARYRTRSGDFCLEGRRVATTPISQTSPHRANYTNADGDMDRNTELESVTPPWQGGALPLRQFREPMTGFEPASFCFEGSCSSSELHRYKGTTSRSLSPMSLHKVSGG